MDTARDTLSLFPRVVLCLWDDSRVDTSVGSRLGLRGSGESPKDMKGSKRGAVR